MQSGGCAEEEACRCRLEYFGLAVHAMRPRSIGLILGLFLDTKLSEMKQNACMTMQLLSRAFHRFQTILQCHKRAKRCTTLAKSHAHHYILVGLLSKSSA